MTNASTSTTAHPKDAHADSPPLSSQQTILACIDGSSVTAAVCDYASWYANQLGLSVSLLHVIDVPKSNRHDLSGAIGVDSRKHLMQDLVLLDEQTARIANKHGEALVQDAKSHILASYPDTKVITHVRRSKLLPAIQHFLKDTRAIILGRRAKDHQNNKTKRVNIGSQIESVIRAVQRPIMVCSDDFIIPDSYMFAFDNSPTAQKAVQRIADSQIAKSLKGHIVMVGHQETLDETALYQAQQQMKTAGFDITAHVYADHKLGHSDVVSALTNFRTQHKISMVVMGAYGHAKWRQFFVGSTTTKLLANTTAPVLLLR